MLNKTHTGHQCTQEDAVQQLSVELHPTISLPSEACSPGFFFVECQGSKYVKVLVLIHLSLRQKKLNCGFCPRDKKPVGVAFLE